MPGRSFESTVEPIPTPRYGSLKGHKSLPRRSHVAAERTPSTRLAGQNSALDHRSDQITFTSAERIKSWVPSSNSSSVRVVPVVGKPLTPPIKFRDDFQSWIDDAALRKRNFRAGTDEFDTSGITPLVQQSPPTPETTPPRKIHRAQAVASFSSRNLPESRTDSFKTAQENLSSDEEDQPPDSPSLHPSRQNLLRSAGIPKQKNVGLGLGLESEDEEPTPRRTTPKESPRTQSFVTFDGAWADGVMDDLKKVEVQEDPLKPVSHTRIPRRTRVVSEPTLDSPTLGVEPPKALAGSLSLRQRVENSRKKKDLGRENVEQWHGPLTNDEPEVDAVCVWSDHDRDHRLSQASTASTVVSAMVINSDSPPQRRQTLRRTTKMPDLSSPPQRSKSNTISSNDTPVRRRLRRSTSPEQELRKSFATDSPDGMFSNAIKTRQDNLPEIPERKSSLRSSASGSKRHSRTFSLTSKQQSSRPTTAPEEHVGYFDIPRKHDRRTMSVVIHGATPFKTENKVKDEPSSAKADSSPPSVPTSAEEPSTATSVTSTGLDAFQATALPNVHPQTISQPIDNQENPTLTIERSDVGEWSSSRPRSTLVTPFSLRSAHSSTPGTLEINEATAVSIYPHTNKSILVIQQMPGDTDSSPPERSAIIAGNANIALPGPIAPVTQKDSPPQEDILNSPLQNPRPPPQPPDFKIIPPTPANAPPSEPSLRRSPPKTPPRTTQNRLSTPITSLKRAFSARVRPHSESFVTPFRRSLSLRGTASSPRASHLHRRSQTVDDNEPASDSKLHPFWRPRGHDHSDSDSDSEFGDMGVLRTNSLGTGHAPQRTTSWCDYEDYAAGGPPGRSMSLTRRISNTVRRPMRRNGSGSVPQRPQRRASVGYYYDPRGHYMDGEMDFHEGEMPGGQTISRFRSLRDRLERKRIAREEEKRAERTKELKSKIGVVADGAGDGIGGTRGKRDGIVFMAKGERFGNWGKEQHAKLT